ncbi:hypothetical protein [Mucilaginibacter arboris]|uniref:Uncharacterized protein n=1 Tax=Mucilaginibacter arboris TaxID=2682090 RepID=A0A7K1SSS0_9SPHI|nr:hypothetical protein [Mucilaginibacter arboris]MVN20359.1 hypothetical protein [Mucilaginibacter arboris]
MTTLNIKIPENKVADVASYVQKIGGEVTQNETHSVTAAAPKPEQDEDEVTHESFFGENIKRAIRAFKS